MWATPEHSLATPYNEYLLHHQTAHKQYLMTVTYQVHKGMCPSNQALYPGVYENYHYRPNHELGAKNAYKASKTESLSGITCICSMILIKTPVPMSGDNDSENHTLHIMHLKIVVGFFT